MTPEEIEYQKKLEQQKKLREEMLAKKEARRKAAAQEKVAEAKKTEDDKKPSTATTGAAPEPNKVNQQPQPLPGQKGKVLIPCIIFL